MLPIINYVAIGLPWGICGLALIGFNLWLNIFWNEWWAGANIWLVGNTVYLIVQYILSVLLVCEFDFMLYWLKFLRWFSLISAYAYTLCYVLAAVKLADLMGDWDGEHIEMTTLILAMTISYNLILNVGILPVNFVIAIKELTMELFQFKDKLAGTGADDYSLALNNIIDFWVNIFDLFNPDWWSGKNKKWFWQ